ncbi:hypothetical protein [Mesorhizobium sp. IMUNJ 23232]|uniref:hypothetical protein n=1 Tax=Mesorhizobium sp. IMUNJ 23232 TaxID=3376064 RepID=UPI00378DC2D7
MFSRFIDLFRRQYNMSKPARRGESIGDVIEIALEGQWPGDFQRNDGVLWVNAPTNHIRRLFRLHAMKGMTFSLCWGISVDFVPCLKSKGLSWKRTAKTARFDLCIDPIDMSGSIPRWCSFDNNEGDRRIGKVALAVHKAAKADWSKLNTLKDVADCFENRSKMDFQRFSLDNYVQTDIAWGLILIALGEREKGEHRLSAFCEKFEIAPDNVILAKARSLAISIAEG